METKDYLEQLETDRQGMVTNLTAKGITGLTGDETFTELVPEVLNIPSGGGGLDWSAIGYQSAPQSIANAYNYAKQIYDNWDNTQTNLSSKFKNDGNLVYMPIVDVSNATGFAEMFSGSAVRDVSLAMGNKVNGLANMFNNCKDLIDGVTISGGTYGTLASCASMFSGCNNLKSLDLSSLNTNKITSMQNMFYECNSLTTLNLKGSFNTSYCDTFYNMFYYCQSLTSLDLSNFTAKNSVSTQGMFKNCTSLMFLDMRNFEFTKVSTFSNMFGGTSSTTRVPYGCEIIVKDQTQKDWFTTNFANYTNVKTVAEYEASLNS